MDENKDSSSSESLYSSDDDSSVQCPPKYTLTEARTIDNHTLTDKELTCTDQIPKYILNKLMRGDYRAREFKVKPLNPSKTKTKYVHDSDDSDDEEERVNPMDALLLLFHLSDECLRQHLALKLDECQLSVPFLLPHPEAPTEKVTILLRALENITKFCRSDASNDKKRTQEVFATEHPFPVVSFIRIGDITMSKSSLINKIMSDGNGHHDFFFHNDVKDPEVYRKIVDGCVELSWYLPGGREKQTLETDICFANLRGDTRVFKKQFRLILKISSVLCILLPSNYQDHTITEILKEATYSPANIILLFNEIRCLDSVEKYFDDMKINHHGKMSLLTNSKKFDEDYFIQKMRINIEKKIHEVKPTPLTKLESRAKEFGFHLDGNESHFTLRKIVDSWLGMGIKEAKIRLKLQMHVPALADLEREKYFSNHDGRTDRIEQNIDKIYKAIEEVKTAQKQSFAHLDERIVHFLNSIAEMNTTERNCTLNKMKHELNKISLQVMPELHEEYRLALLKNRDKQAQEWKHLQQLEESITTHSFGLEHIIRELAQLYEIEECKYDYAGAAADMLLSGQPLEILDGDSFYIPLEWFNAVYTKLEQKTSDAKLFVISVLGIQSSGKSTMLNTMFGLEFPVSAGRCTRGVFASLLPVSDSTKCNSSPEYVLILDSEGFRGSRNHENKLGMFVIGAADLTIVNIFGISRDEITQFFDKTVHAFLRTKLLTEKKSCKIVHQNFEAADEREKIDDVRRNLKQDLDRMTKLAATQENCVAQFQHFNEVVSFDENKDVFYIPSLYQGNSPMAPRSPEYGRAVQRIKENIITLMCSEEMYKFSISQFRERICNLWEVILRSGIDEPKHEDHSTLSTDEFKKTRRQEIAETKFFHDLIVKPVSKFTLQQARTVCSHILTPDELMSEDKIPDYIFEMLMTANYHVRKFKIKPFPSNLDETEDSFESEDSDEDDQGINPMDAILSVFYNSDNTLRRYIVHKLSVCQLSVPFLLPDPLAPSENVTILLSTLENITKCWQDSSGIKQVFATEHPFPVVSFIRIGKITTSKSSLINKIMSDGSNHHDFFFHRCMEGGHFERKIVDGLVEMSWYLPRESEKQTCQNEICFMNLRGDAGVLKKQRNVLSKISSVLCILLPSEYPDETRKKILEEAMDDKAKIILIFLEKPGQETKQYFKELEGEKLSSITRSKRANEHEFVKMIQEKVIGKLQDVQTTPLRDLASLASEHCINYNIGQTQTKFEENVDKWLKIGIKEAKDLLTLQLHVPVLADLEREKYRPRRRGTKSLKDDMDKIYNKIKDEKNAQKKSLKELDRRFLDFLVSLSKMNVTERVKALTRLKHQLNKMSLRVMAELHGEDQKKEAATSQELKEKRLKHSREKSKFGLEHIIRELAQLYQLGESKYDFADVAAEMLLSGQPLELVDGDSSYIPLEWFKAVYTKLEKKTKNATIFVISVLGIQSSGKSTMLNTMFGLKPPVSAGRCTRGAFASLLPVSDSLKTASKFDYVLIVDTEGLSGSGDPKVREHDNELATFVIGVADLTIVNIMGENPNEIKEFLNIYMHAFLKMKLVKEKNTCKIVHQNVAATDARDKLTDDRLKLKKDLDKMAKLAAIQENCEEEIQKLDDIISFNENEDVFYIPSLLQGNPPMAPVNPNYGRAVQKVKENIISLMSSKHDFQLSIAQFRERVCNLWNAMLKENFIFNFRNVIEVRAYAALDRKYFEESVNLMVTGMTELKTRIEVALSRCTTREEREEEWKESRKQIWNEAANLGKKMETGMKRFLEENEDKATLEQWRENTMLKIKQMEKNQKLEVTTYCSEAFRYLQNRQDVDEKKQSFEKEILYKAKKFITSAQNTDDTEKCLAAFEQEWKKWMADIPHYQESKTDVADVMVNVLCETNPALNTQMTEKIKKQNYQILNFKKKVPVLTFSSLVPMSIQTMAKFFNLLNKQQDSSGRNINDQAVDSALDFAKKKAKSGVRCTRNDLTSMYHKVITTLDKEAEKSKFKFHDLFKCDILLYAFAHTYDIFDQMEQRYLEERDIKGDLEKNLRPRLETYFKNLCDKMGKEMSAATSFVDVLRTPIESALNRAMGPAVAKQVLKVSKFQSKGQFHASVLIELGKEAEFKSYIPYLQNPVKFLRTKLIESIEDYCINEDPDSIISVLEVEVDKLKEDVSTGILSAKEETENHGEKLTFWIQQFVSKCFSLAITKEMFAVAAIDDDLKDIDVFEAQVQEKIDEFFVSLIERGINDSIMGEWDPSPHDHLFSSIFGCQSCCPFCKGLCDQTNQNHAGSHSTRIHRAQGLSGYHNVDTKILCSTICTNDVANEKRRFRNKETAGEWHYYKDYQSVNDYYKSWQIPGDESFELSKYWQWFMAKFSKELANFYEVEEPEIPSTWKDRTFEEVEHDLRQEYNMLPVSN